MVDNLLLFLISYCISFLIIFNSYRVYDWIKNATKNKQKEKLREFLKIETQHKRWVERIFSYAKWIITKEYTKDGAIIVCIKSKEFGGCNTIGYRIKTYNVIRGENLFDSLCTDKYESTLIELISNNMKLYKFDKWYP